jgi:hypothetical protein
VTENNGPEKKVFEPMRPIGVFLSVFGVAVTAAPLVIWIFHLLDNTKPLMPATDAAIDIISGLVTIAIGSVFFIIGWRRLKSGAAVDASQWQ